RLEGKILALHRLVEGGGGVLHAQLAPARLHDCLDRLGTATGGRLGGGGGGSLAGGGRRGRLGSFGGLRGSGRRRGGGGRGWLGLGRGTRGAGFQGGCAQHRG